MIEYRIKTNIYTRNEQRLNTNMKIYNSNEEDRIKIYIKKESNNATFGMPYPLLNNGGQCILCEFNFNVPLNPSSIMHIFFVFFQAQIINLQRCQVVIKIW